MALRMPWARIWRGRPTRSSVDAGRARLCTAHGREPEGAQGPRAKAPCCHMDAAQSKAQLEFRRTEETAAGGASVVPASAAPPQPLPSSHLLSSWGAGLPGPSVPCCPLSPAAPRGPPALQSVRHPLQARPRRAPPPAPRQAPSANLVFSFQSPARACLSPPRVHACLLPLMA